MKSIITLADTQKERRFHTEKKDTKCKWSYQGSIIEVDSDQETSFGYEKRLKIRTEPKTIEEETS